MFMRNVSFLLGAFLAGIAQVPMHALAQEVVFVFGNSEVGTPGYNVVMATNTNAAYPMIYDSLVAQDADLTFHPHLAESWEEAADGMAWTFRLRPGVIFHNGKPFTASDVARFIDMLRPTENNYMVEAIAAVETPDDLTVKFVMAHPDPNLLYNLASAFMGIPDPDAVIALGEDYGITEAVGTGPFKLESFVLGQETVVVRNEDYAWASPLSANQGPAKIERIIFREIPEVSTAFLELKSGGVDALLSLPTDYLAEIEGDPTLAVQPIPGQDVYYMAINVTQEPFTDIRVRQAAALAIDQEDILANVFAGYGAVVDGFLISALPEAKLDASLAIRFDPEKAKALLDAAGWLMGADGVREKKGQRLQVSLWTQNDSIFRRLTEVVQAQLKAVGFDAQIQTFDSATIRDLYKTGEQQLAVRSYYWNNADIIDWFFSGERLGYPNISMFNDPKAEELRLKAMKGSATSAEREANFLAYHAYVTSQFPYAPIYQPPWNMAYNLGRLEMPEKIRGTGINGVVMLDIGVDE